MSVFTHQKKLKQNFQLFRQPTGLKNSRIFWCLGKFRTRRMLTTRYALSQTCLETTLSKCIPLYSVVSMGNKEYLSRW